MLSETWLSLLPTHPSKASHSCSQKPQCVHYRWGSAGHMVHDSPKARTPSVWMLIHPSFLCRASCPSVSMWGVGGTLIPSQSSSGDIKEVGMGPLPGTAGGIRLAKPSLLPFALWHGSFAFWGFSEPNCPRALGMLSGTGSLLTEMCGAVLQWTCLGAHQWLLCVCGRGHFNPRGQLGFFICIVVITSPASLGFLKI